jgi:hypothetical protein
MSDVAEFFTTSRHFRYHKEKPARGGLGIGKARGLVPTPRLPPLRQVCRRRKKITAVRIRIPFHDVPSTFHHDTRGRKAHEVELSRICWLAEDAGMERNGTSFMRVQ